MIFERRIKMFDFGERLKGLRKEKGYSQKNLAAKLNVSQNTVLRWENNYKSPTLHNLIELSVLLETSLDYLAGIATKRPVITDRLTQEQITILNMLALEFQFRKKGSGLTQRQMNVLNELIIAFTK